MENDAQLVIRLPSELMAKVDEHAAELSKAAGGVPVSRGAAVRALLWQVLGEGEPPKPRRKAKR